MVAHIPRPNGRILNFVTGGFLFLELVTLSTSPTNAAPDSKAASPPPTRREEVTETLHGVKIVDPYRWLEDQNSPETRAWIEAQNDYTRSQLQGLPGREKMAKQIATLLKLDTVGVPIARGSRYFFSKRSSDQDLFTIYMREGLRGVDEVLINPHTMSADKMTSVVLLDVSRDGKLLAYGVREGGADEMSIRVFDIEARKDLPDELPKGRYWGISFKPNRGRGPRAFLQPTAHNPQESGFYYTRHGKEGPRVYFHKIGTMPSEDPILFGKEYGPEKIVGAQVSPDGRYLLFTVYHGSAARKTEVYFQNIAENGPLLTLVNDIEARFEGEIGGDTLFLETDWQAPNGRILAVDLRNPARERWREVVPTGKGIITGFSLVGGRLCVNYLENVVSRIKIFEVDGRPVREIDFPTLGSASRIHGEWDSPEAFYSFSSFHVPPTIYRYHVKSGSQGVWSRLNAPVKSSRFEVKQVWYTSKDGTQVPMFLLHAKGLKRDGVRPTVLTGYGGFKSSMTPWFSASAVLWAESGGVYAVANLRGGGEFGEEWHRAGMLEKKQNTFDDFIAAAEWLIQNGYTKPEKLAISGGSNGGLLVGVAMTQRPELFRAVVCTVPLLDMLRYHKFLVARFWVPEYGSADNPEQFPYLYAYSPYHHVKPGTPYPAVLFVTGDSDTRVAPLHARKMTALLQWATGSDRPILLHYDTKAGHAGGMPLSKQLEDLTDIWSFIYWQLGAAL